MRKCLKVLLVINTMLTLVACGGTVNTADENRSIVETEETPYRETVNVEEPEADYAVWEESGTDYTAWEEPETDYAAWEEPEADRAAREEPEADRAAREEPAEKSVAQMSKEAETNANTETESSEYVQDTQPDIIADNGADSVEDTATLCTREAKVIFDSTNEKRVAEGLEPLTWSDDLAIAAGTRANECITNFSHTRPDGSRGLDISPLASAENLIRGPHTDGAEMVDKWMTSEGHKNNILHPDLKIIGVAYLCTEKGDIGVQLFGW